MSEKRRCAYTDCRAWPVRGTEWCKAHPEGQPRSPNRSERKRGGKVGNQNTRKHGVYAEYVPVVALKDALKLPPGDLRLEIAVTRAVLREILDADLDTSALIAGLERATGALTRLLKTNKQIGAESQDELERVVDLVLKDIGLEGGHG